MLHIIKISIILALANGLCQELVKMLTPIMDKVVILARVSTDKQEYQRQVNELTDYCTRVGWSVKAVFSNKVSGAKRMEERPEIMDLIEFVKSNDIDKVVCLEISRLGRNTLEALKVIECLNEHRVSLYVKNYNLETLTPDGKVNPVASLICTILLEIASMELEEAKEQPMDKEVEEKMKFSLSFIENMGSCVAAAPIHLKLNILGSIFNGKIVFENSVPRTATLSPLVSLIVGEPSIYKVPKTKQPSDSSESCSRGG